MENIDKFLNNRKQIYALYIKHIKEIHVSKADKKRIFE